MMRFIFIFLLTAALARADQKFGKVLISTNPASSLSSVSNGWLNIEAPGGIKFGDNTTMTTAAGSGGGGLTTNQTLGLMQSYISITPGFLLTGGGTGTNQSLAVNGSTFTNTVNGLIGLTGSNLFLYGITTSQILTGLSYAAASGGGTLTKSGNNLTFAPADLSGATNLVTGATNATAQAGFSVGNSAQLGGVAAAGYATTGSVNNISNTLAAATALKLDKTYTNGSYTGTSPTGTIISNGLIEALGNTPMTNGQPVTYGQLPTNIGTNYVVSLTTSNAGVSYWTFSGGQWTLNIGTNVPAQSITGLQSNIMVNGGLLTLSGGTNIGLAASLVLTNGANVSLLNNNADYTTLGTVSNNFLSQSVTNGTFTGTATLGAVVSNGLLITQSTIVPLTNGDTRGITFNNDATITKAGGATLTVSNLVVQNLIAGSTTGSVSAINGLQGTVTLAADSPGTYTASGSTVTYHPGSAAITTNLMRVTMPTTWNSPNGGWGRMPFTNAFGAAVGTVISWSNINTNFTVSQNGIYLFSYCVDSANNIVNPYFALYTNNVPAFYDSTGGATIIATFPVVANFPPVYLTTNDSVAAYLYTSATAGIGARGTNTWFSCVRITQ